MKSSKIEKIYNIIKDNLTDINIYPIKIYKTTRSLLKSYSKKAGLNYKWLINYYNKYYTDNKYVKTKYFIKHCNNANHRVVAYNINALSGNPIRISYENVEHRPEHEIAFLILHEICHNEGILDEKIADRYAIKYVKKLIRRGLIKNEYDEK